MPIGPVSIIDTFTRSQDGNWGFTDNVSESNNRHNWLNEDESYWAVDLTDGIAHIDAYSDFPDYQCAYINLANEGIHASGNQRVLALVRWTATMSSPSVDHGPAIRIFDEDNFHYLSILPSKGQIVVKHCSNGNISNVATANVSLVKDTWYWVKFEYNNSYFKGKIWKKENKEPSSYNINHFFPFLVASNANPPPMNVGYVARKTSTNYTVHIDTYYFWALDDINPTLGSVVHDDFNRNVANGWGKTSSGHIWEGHVSSTPELPTNFTSQMEGLVTDTGGTFARVLTGAAEDTLMWINQTTTGDQSTYIEYQTNAGSTNVELYIGLCGALTQSTSGVLFSQGYAAKLVRNATNFTLHEVTSTGTFTTLGTASASAFGFGLGSNTVYKIRVARMGTQIYARLWTGVTEPSTWNLISVSDSTYSGGKPFLLIRQVDAVTRTFDFHQFSHGAYVAAGTAHTETGAITVPSPSATTLPFEVSYLQDSPANNSITMEYRKTGTTSWTLFGGALTRGTQKWTGTITGLDKNTSYDLRATFTDTNGVIGDNPILGTFTTTATGVSLADLSVSNILTTQVTLQQDYEDDTNDNSTATYARRTVGVDVEDVVDTFTDNSGVHLVDHVPDIGTTWVRHGHSNNGNLVLWRNQVFFESDGVTTGRAVYYSPTYSGQNYSVTANVYIAEQRGIVGVAGRVQTGANTYYALGYNADEAEFQLISYKSGTFVELATFAYLAEQGESFSMTLRMDGGDIYGYHNDNVIMKVTDGSPIAAGYAGIRILDNTPILGNVLNHAVIDSFTTSHRASSGAWSGETAMTANRTEKYFSVTASGLTAGQLYEFRTTVSDTNGVFGAPNRFTTVQLKGNEVALEEVLVTPSPTTAYVEVLYDRDANNNSEITMQYKSVLDRHWKTVPPTQIRVDRTAKVFSTVLSGLRPGLSHEVVVRITDINGIAEDTPSRLDKTFQTTTYFLATEKRRKHHLFKVYDEDDKYITTWEDAQEPEFSFYENGGVSDLRLTLPRPISSINEPLSGISFRNRVDVWELDPSSDGFGINMVENPTFEPSLGGWILDTGGSGGAIIGTDYGPGDGSGLKIESSDATMYVARSNYIQLYESSERGLRGKYANSNPVPVPLVVMCMARAKNTKLILDVEAYGDDPDVIIGGSPDLGMTVGNDWQVVRLEYTPPHEAKTLRIILRNAGAGTVYAGNVSVRAKEALVYRGHIETFTPTVDESGESIDVEVLGLVSFLSDDYIDFLQYIEDSAQPQNDLDAGRPNNPPTDPAQMLRDIIDIARQQNPRCPLYYTETSIQNTGQLMRYTFRNRQLRGCFDKVRELCPAGWHYYIAQDGCVFLRDSASAPTHRLRVGVEVLKFKAERSIRNLKNYVVVKGRQDEDRSERGTHGTVREVAFDQASISKWGRRVLQINDAQITNPDDAELIAAGRLEEHNHEEQQVACDVVDEKSLEGAHESLRGYNIESFRPGDNVLFFDPLSGPNKTYWNQFNWDEGYWDYGQDFSPLTDAVPIKRIQYHGDFVTLELSERQPSSIGDFGRMYRVLQLRSEETGE